MDKARLLASTIPHTNDWLYTLSITACGDGSNETIRVAVGLGLGLTVCESHQCPYGANGQLKTDARTVLYKKHWSFNLPQSDQRHDLVGLKYDDVPATKEPVSLLRGDEKRLDGLTPWQSGRCLSWDATVVTPWQSGRCLSWDATVVDTLVSSYMPTTSVIHCEVAEAVAL